MPEAPADLPSPRSPRRGVRFSVLLVLLTSGAFAGYRHYQQRPLVFIQQWSEQFRSVNSLEAARRLEQSQPVYVRTFPSGEWFIATCEHSCCTGAGFNATVIHDSTGATYVDRTYSFCGIEGMGGELSQDAADSLSTFYPQLRQLKLQKQ